MGVGFVGLHSLGVQGMGKKRTLADDLNDLQRREDAKVRYGQQQSLGFRDTVRAGVAQAKYELRPYFAGTSPMKEMGEKVSFEGRRFGAGKIPQKGRRRKQA